MIEQETIKLGDMPKSFIDLLTDIYTEQSAQNAIQILIEAQNNE